MTRSNGVKLESPLPHDTASRTDRKGYAKPRVTGLGLLRRVTKFTVGILDPTTFDWHPHGEHQFRWVFQGGEWTLPIQR